MGLYQLALRGRDVDDLNMVKQEPFVLSVAIYEIFTWRRPSDNLGEDSCEVDVNILPESVLLIAACD